MLLLMIMIMSITAVMVVMPRPQEMAIRMRNGGRRKREMAAAAPALGRDQDHRGSRTFVAFEEKEKEGRKDATRGEEFCIDQLRGHADIDLNELMNELCTS